MVKYVMSFLLFFAIILTGYIAYTQPSMHNQVSLSVIDYKVIHKSDGSIQRTKQITTTKLEDIQK